MEEKLWFQHGGEATVKSYQNCDAVTQLKHIHFLQSLQDYYLDDENRLFIHAGFTNMKGVDYEYFKPLFYWDRTLWETALALDPNLSKEDITYPNRLTIYKEIYIGHTPVTKINETVPVNKACVWNVDTGASVTGAPITYGVGDTQFVAV